MPPCLFLRIEARSEHIARPFFDPSIANETPPSFFPLLFAGLFSHPWLFLRGISSGSSYAHLFGIVHSSHAVHMVQQEKHSPCAMEGCLVPAQGESCVIALAQTTPIRAFLAHQPRCSGNGFSRLDHFLSRFWYHHPFRCFAASIHGTLTEGGSFLKGQAIHLHRCIFASGSQEVSAGSPGYCIDFITMVGVSMPLLPSSRIPNTDGLIQAS